MEGDSTALRFAIRYWTDAHDQLLLAARGRGSSYSWTIQGVVLQRVVTQIWLPSHASKHMFRVVLQSTQLTCGHPTTNLRTQPFIAIATYTQACYPGVDKDKTACRPASHAVGHQEKAELYMLHTTLYLASSAQRYASVYSRA